MQIDKCCEKHWQKGVWIAFPNIFSTKDSRSHRSQRGSKYRSSLQSVLVFVIFSNNWKLCASKAWCWGWSAIFCRKWPSPLKLIKVAPSIPWEILAKPLPTEIGYSPYILVIISALRYSLWLSQWAINKTWLPKPFHLLWSDVWKSLKLRK